MSKPGVPSSWQSACCRTTTLPAEVSLTPSISVTPRPSSLDTRPPPVRFPLAVDLPRHARFTLAGVLAVIEGEMENQDDLIVLLSEYGRFGWETLPSAPGRAFTTTQTFNITGENKGPVDFQTEFDWQTRHWQYLNATGDRRSDFVNFRDKQVNLDCPRLHNYTQALYARCLTLNSVDTGPEWLDSTVVLNYHYAPQSLARFQSSEAYEQCLADHVAALGAYKACVRTQLPNYDAFDDWHVQDRECVGGGGRCGPPVNGVRPVPRPNAV